MSVQNKTVRRYCSFKMVPQVSARSLKTGISRRWPGIIIVWHLHFVNYFHFQRKLIPSFANYFNVTLSDN